MSEWNKFQSLHRGKSKKEISRLYQKYKKGKNVLVDTLKPLTVNILRDEYWDKKNNKGRPVNLYISQTYDGKDIDGNPLTTESLDIGSPEIFITGGHLIHKWGKNIYPATTGPILNQHMEIIENWLSKSNSGPYKDKSKDSDDFYYLTGYYKHQKQDEYTELQICSSPFNALSTDCLDEVNCYIIE